MGSLPFDSVLDINIYYNKSIEKQTIKGHIISSDQDSAKTGQIIAFNTDCNITQYLITDKFKVDFIRVNDSDYNITEQECYFKSNKNYYGNNNLMLLCTIKEEGMQDKS